MRQGPGLPVLILTILMAGGELVRSSGAVPLFTEVKLTPGIVGFEVTELFLDNRTPPPRGGIRRICFRRQPANSRVNLASQTQRCPFAAELEQKWLRTPTFTESESQWHVVNKKQAFLTMTISLFTEPSKPPQRSATLFEVDRFFVFERARLQELPFSLKHIIKVDLRKFNFVLEIQKFKLSPRLRRQTMTNTTRRINRFRPSFSSSSLC